MLWPWYGWIGISCYISVDNLKKECPVWSTETNLRSQQLHELRGDTRSGSAVSVRYHVTKCDTFEIGYYVHLNCNMNCHILLWALETNGWLPTSMFIDALSWIGARIVIAVEVWRQRAWGCSLRGWWVSSISNDMNMHLLGSWGVEI